MIMMAYVWLSAPVLRGGLYWSVKLVDFAKVANCCPATWRGYTLCVLEGKLVFICSKTLGFVLRRLEI